MTARACLLACLRGCRGGAWDNAKKYIETGAHGGKNSVAHHAAGAYVDLRSCLYYMHVNVCMCMCMCVHLCISVCECESVCMIVHVRLCMCTHSFMHLCVF